ncbi:TetR/AcrR family transcriptional regulator [Opitutaceae bacterium TAV4]|nr:TetR/AcrR family transcriptional regulator [Opitutaceae bacterium TAV4]RRK02327.1 TetR/AcrR family transcriptional regulator [Opitutaceae bacterium TAV3]
MKKAPADTKARSRPGQRTRTTILKAASTTFARKGYSEATARDIAKAAGVPLGSLLYYFGNKERLFLEAIRHYILEVPQLKQVFDPLFTLATLCSSPAPQQVSNALHASVKNLMLLTHGPNKLPAINGLLLRVFADGFAEAQILVLKNFAPMQYRVAELLTKLCPDDRPEHDMEAWFSLFWAQVFYPITTRGLRLLDRGWQAYPLKWILHASHRIAWYQCLPLGLPEPDGRVEMPVIESIKIKAAREAEMEATQEATQQDAALETGRRKTGVT